jgi:hypothetical protein
MQTTDMPIVYPPSFKTLGFFLSTSTHIFLDADLQSKHMGETRHPNKSFMLTTPFLWDYVKEVG